MSIDRHPSVKVAFFHAAVCRWRLLTVGSALHFFAFFKGADRHLYRTLAKRKDIKSEAMFDLLLYVEDKVGNCNTLFFVFFPAKAQSQSRCRLRSSSSSSLSSYYKAPKSRKSFPSRPTTTTTWCSNVSREEMRLYS